MIIQEYLFDKHLKPLFIFNFNVENNPVCFGLFVGSKGAKPTGDGGFVNLKWDGENKKPFWSCETPLWILPLINKNGVYNLDYDNDIALPKNIQSCFIRMLNQPGKTGTKVWTKWEEYNDFKINDVSNFNHSLNFKTQRFGLEKKSSHTISSDDKSIRVWLSDGDAITTKDRLLRFGGIEAEIVDVNGEKWDYEIWCGIRTKANANKITLSINIENFDINNRSEIKDCPIVWSTKGLMDDTIYPNQGTDTFSIKNNKLALGNHFNNVDYLSYKLSFIDYRKSSNVKYIEPNRNYAWFIRERDKDGNGKYLYPFFKRVNQKIIPGRLDPFLRNSEYRFIYFFQVNRYDGKNFTKHITSWVTAAFNIGILKETFTKISESRGSVDKAAQESITPKIGNFQPESQITLEHSITGGKVSFEAIKFYASPPKYVPFIDKLHDLAVTNQEVTLPNFKNTTDGKDLTIKGLKFSTEKKADAIWRANDNGTLFAFSMEEGLVATPNTINDGSFAFELDGILKAKGNIYFSLQSQEAQKPLYLWELHEAINATDIIPCYSIEDFELPVNKISPLSTDLSEKEKYIADDDSSSLVSSGTLRSTPPLIIPLTKPSETQRFYLSLSENINIGQDFNLSVELIHKGEKADANKEETLEVIVLGHEPQTTIKITTPFGTSPRFDNNKWIVARKNNLSIDGAIWEILNDSAENDIVFTFPPQAIGEAFRKTNQETGILIIPGEPEDEKLVQFKFGPPAQLTIANEQLNRQMVTAPWNIRHLFGTYGDSNPGLRLLKSQFELLYGMSAELDNKDAFIAELENKLGQAVKAPRGKIVWQKSKQQDDAFKKAYSDFIEMLKLFNSRLAIYEVSATDKFQPAKFTEGINYFFRADETKGAKLQWPFKGEVPTYLEEIKNKFHRKDGLAGGFHFGFESLAVYKELWDTGFRRGSSSGEIEDIAFSSLGGYGKQVARFCNDKTTIKSTTSLGRTHFYAVERIGRIGVLWNKAKHVIEYERTIIPSVQFKKTANIGRVVVRKVREFVEILEPERRYPEFGADTSSSGSILGSHFKSIKIPVSSSWGNDIVRKDGSNEIAIGWEVPLWNSGVNDPEVYPFPQIMLALMASKESQLKEVLCNVSNPEDIYFYTDVRDEVNSVKITANTDQWPGVVNVDYTLQPFENIYLGAVPCLNYNDPKLINTPLPSPLDVLPGFERYTFRIVPSDVPISANGAYNKDSNVVGKLRTVTMQRKPAIKTGTSGNPVSYITQEQKDRIAESQQFIKENINGYYTELVRTALQSGQKLKVEEKLKEELVNHLSSIAKTKVDLFTGLTDKINELPNLKYLNRASDNSLNITKFNENRKSANTDGKGTWGIPTVAFWAQLTKQIDAGIGAVDKNYTLLFDEAKKEMDELVNGLSIEEAKKIVLERIDIYKELLTDLKSQFDINLDTFENLINAESKKLIDFLETVDDPITLKLDECTAELRKLIEQINDPATTLDQFKTTVRDNLKIWLEDTIDEFLKRLNINDATKVSIKKELTKYINEYIIKEVNTFLDSLTLPLDLEYGKKEVIKILNQGNSEAKKQLGILKNTLKKAVETEIIAVTTEINGLTQYLRIKLEAVHSQIGKFFDDLKSIIDAIDTAANNAIQAIKDAIELFFRKAADGEYDKVKEMLQLIITEFQMVLIENYLVDLSQYKKPIAHLFYKADNWLKGKINSIQTFLNDIKAKLGTNTTIGQLKTLFGENLEYFTAIYNEYAQLKEAIENGGPDAIIKEANKLSQAINKDFGGVIGELTNSYYKAADLTNAYNDLDNELQGTLFNYRSVFQEIKAVDLGFNRQTIELIYNFDQNMAPRLLLTPVMGKLQKLNDGLNSMGISIPYAGLEDKFIAPLKEWGGKFAESYSGKFPLSNLLNDLGGIKFDNLFPFLKSDDAFFKAIKISHDLNKEAMKAWVKAEADYTFTTDNTFMTIGPVKVTMLRNARITALAYESIDIDRNRKSENFGSLKATFEISLTGTPLMLFKETVVSFKNGKYDFDLDPSRMEMPGLLKLLTDASKNIQTAAPADSNKKSPFKLEILKIKQHNLELPIGAKATLDIPPLSIGGGPTSMSNLSFGGNFIMKAIDDSNPANLKLDFLVGLGFYFGKKELPFNFTAFILGGGGYIDCNFRYQPSKNNSIQVDFIMSVNGSAAFALSTGWISGSIMILAGIEVQYVSGRGGSTRIEIYVEIIGVVDIMGLISIYLSLRLGINYLSDQNGTVLYGAGTVKVKIKICAFVTIKVSKSYTMILKGESKSVSNSRSEEISTSLN